MSQAASLRIPAAAERPAPVSGYATRDVAALLGLSVAQVRSYIRDGFLTTAQGARGGARGSARARIALRDARRRRPPRALRRAGALLHPRRIPHSGAGRAWRVPLLLPGSDPPAHRQGAARRQGAAPADPPRSPEAPPAAPRRRGR